MLGLWDMSKTPLLGGFGKVTHPKTKWIIHPLPPEVCGVQLEALIMMAAASHSAANCPSASWKSPLDEANRTTSSAKSKDPTMTVLLLVIIKNLSKKHISELYCVTGCSFIYMNPG